MKVNPRRPPQRKVKHQRLIGVLVLVGAYAGCGAMLYLLLAGPPSPRNYAEYEEETGWPLPSYHVLLCCMLPTVFWLWALLAWLGMKWFRHG